MRVRVFETDDPNSEPSASLGPVRDVDLGQQGSSPDQVLQVLSSQFPGVRLFAFNSQDEVLPGWEEVTVANAARLPAFLAQRKQLKAVRAAAAPSQLVQDMLETKTATLAIQKMIKEKSEASRHASSISPDDLESLLVALRCVVIPVEDDIKDSLADTTEFAWQDNKYEPQQQEQYLATLKSEVQLPSHAYWVSGAKDDQRLLKTSMCTGGADLPFPVGCKTDECVAMKRSQASVEASFAATVEIKKKVVQQSLRQTRTQFICASLKSQLPVISTVTDMEDVGVAYYTTGQTTKDGWTVITERVFASAKAMMQFLGSAMRSIKPDVLRIDDSGNFNLPDILPEPKRMRLPVPAPSHTTVLQRLNLVQQTQAGSDIGNLADFDE